MNRIGKQIENKNGITYTVLAIYNNSAVLFGGHDYVVIRDLDYFDKNGAWGNGKYFPCFDEESSRESLLAAMYYLRHFDYGSYEED